MSFYAITNHANGDALAYVIGVMLGDGCLYHLPAGGRSWDGRVGGESWRVELNVTDEPFAVAFAERLNRALRRPEGRYAHVAMRPPQAKRAKPIYRVSMASKGFGDWWQSVRYDIEAIWPHVERWPAEFLRGLYDSEGNLTHMSHGRGRQPGRKVQGGYVARIFSQRHDTLVLAQRALQALGLRGEIRLFRRAGTTVRTPSRTVTSGSDLWHLRPAPTRLFLERVGSTIPRKTAPAEELAAGRVNRLTPAARAELYAAFEAGEHADRLAERYGITRQGVGRVVSRLRAAEGLPPRTVGWKRKGIT